MSFLEPVLPIRRTDAEEDGLQAILVERRFAHTWRKIRHVPVDLTNPSGKTANGEANRLAHVDKVVFLLLNCGVVDVGFDEAQTGFFPTRDGERVVVLEIIPFGSSVFLETLAEEREALRSGREVEPLWVAGIFELDDNADDSFNRLPSSEGNFGLAFDMLSLLVGEGVVQVHGAFVLEVVVRLDPERRTVLGRFEAHGG